MENDKVPSFLTSLLAGAVAGLTVDLSLFPLDSLKTRLQSKQGFWKSGGFQSIYKGVGPVALGAAPCAAIFFATYDNVKMVLLPLENKYGSLICHMASASIAELSVKILHVPMEVVKQRRQTTHGVSPMKIAKLALQKEGICGLYRGFCSTVVRDLPYSVIEIPMWEGLKSYWSTLEMRKVTPVESALCGSIAGSVAAGVTTPLDVTKTRIMLTTNSTCKQQKVAQVLQEIYREKGIRGLFAGCLPRVIMVFFGSGIFFGCYEFSRDYIIEYSLIEKLI